MYKIITLPTRQGYAYCLDCLVKNKALQQHTKKCGALRTLIVPENQVPAFQKILGKMKYHISDNVKVKLHRSEEIPWGVERVGAPAFWKQTKGQGIKVAVIDTGISGKHPDLRGRVKGRVTVVNGRRDSSTGMDGHGTHVAGTIAAIANRRGIVGVAPAVELYDVRAFAPDGTATIADIVEGINWCIENGMHVINMSFGTPKDNQALRHAVKQAARAGIVMVASAGNNGGNLEYPAAYREVVAVGAIDRNNRLAPFSARGPGIDVFAPGVGIKSTWLNGTYRVLDGTSMAAAHISGLYALMLANKGKNRRSIVRNYRKLIRVTP